MKQPPIVFLLGPSGVGKSSLGRTVAANFNFLHLEIDRFPDDGIDLESLRPEWDQFWEQNVAQSLADTVRARVAKTGAHGALLSFAGNVVLSPSHLSAARSAEITPVVLYGTGAECMNAFLARERDNGRGLGANHWIQHNAAPYALYSEPCFEPYRLCVFENGRFRDATAVAAEVAARVEWA